MQSGLARDLEKILAALARLFAAEGMAREVALLASAHATIQQTDYDNWNGGHCRFTIYLGVPDPVFAQIMEEKCQIAQLVTEKINLLTPQYLNESVEAVEIWPELVEDADWREKAKAFVAGKGVTNQGRARSDNIAPRMCDGLLFRSQPEINLYRALKALGVSFAPLPVFVRGGETYRRIEPDFVVFKDGVLMIVEVDGDTVHRESPLEAHNRTTMLVHEGAHVERVNADECNTLDSARICAARLTAIITKLKATR